MSVAVTGPTVSDKIGLSTADGWASAEAHGEKISVASFTRVLHMQNAEAKEVKTDALIKSGPPGLDLKTHAKPRDNFVHAQSQVNTH